DFYTYELKRVGLMPFAGTDLDPARARALQLAFFSELSQSTPFELVLLDAADLEQVETSEPYRRGAYKPKTIIGVSKRYNLDAIVFGTVTEERSSPPQILSLEIDLVAAETGLVIWSSAVHLDAADQRVRDGLELFYEKEADDDSGTPSWELSL